MTSETPIFDVLIGEQDENSYVRKLLGFGYRDALLPPKLAGPPLTPDAIHDPTTAVLARLRTSMHEVLTQAARGGDPDAQG